MKKTSLIPIFAALLFASCVSIPTELYDAVTALRLRATRFPPVQTYARQDFSQGEDTYNEAAQLITTKKDIKRTPELLTAAQTAYLKVIEVGMPAYTVDLSKEIDRVLEEAVALKANAGLKTSYEAIVADYDAAKVLATASDFDTALEKLETVKTNAQNLLETAKKLRDSSLTELATVQEKQARLEIIVQNIEQLAQDKGE